MSRRIGHSFETSPAIAKQCPRCRTPILTGLAEGIHAYVDVLPLSDADETAAIAAGRQTYTLRRSGLIHRNHYRRADPTLASPILAEHDCPRRPR